jgi:hypothetical protein
LLFSAKIIHPNISAVACQDSGNSSANPAGGAGYQSHFP